MKIEIPYAPHDKQREVHSDEHQYRVVAAGRRGGKTTLAINELIKVAIQNPNRRSWYVAPTYRQAKSVVWDNPKNGIFSYLPRAFIQQVYRTELRIILTNGHVIELKGAENKDKLRGVGLLFAVLDEFGFMDSDVWPAIIQPMLAESKGRALFIGTPSLNGSPHFHDLYKIGQMHDPDYRSWLFYTKDNPYIPAKQIELARKTLPVDMFRREYEADFSIAEGLVYDNFDYSIHVVPSYEPGPHDFVVGGVDPGLMHTCAAVLTAWSPDGTCRIFKEYYQKGFLAEQNAEHIKAISEKYRPRYWIIDRASLKQDPRTGLTVYGAYKKYLYPLGPSKSGPGSVILGINEVKTLFQPHADTKIPKVYVSAELTNFINEIQHYVWYEPKHEMYQTPPEKPRKYKDDLMDAFRIVVMSKPWMHKMFVPYIDDRIRNYYSGY